MFELALYRGNRLLSILPLHKKENKIGRDPQCDLILIDPAISRVHIRVIAKDADQHHFIDQSTNGTALNGHACARKRLHPTDRIDIGPFHLIYRTHDGNALPTLKTQRLVKSPAYPPPSAAPASARPLAPALPTALAEGSPPAYSRLQAWPAGTTWPVDRALGNQQGTETDQISGPGLRHFHGMVSQSSIMKQRFLQIQRFAAQKEPVLILGETGTGKELVARALHQGGPLKSGPFIALNCGALSEELAESELFGHEKGAFTGANQSRDGAFAQARGGTLFLDEVGELSLRTQVKLLRVLESGEFSRVGSHRLQRTQVRVVAATHRDLCAEVEAGRFRQDLLFRLFVLPIELPPLRQRAEDIQPLIAHFLTQFGQRRGLSNGALTRLLSHDWPGNIRELRHVLARAYALCPSACITEEHIHLLRGPTQKEAPEDNALVTLDQMEKRAIQMALRLMGTKSAAAKALGIARSTLHLKMKKYDLEGLAAE